MTMLLTFKYRLMPTRQQYRDLEAVLEQQRQLYNAALEERIEVYHKSLGSSVQIEWVPLEKPIRKANGEVIEGYYGRRRHILMKEDRPKPRTITEADQSRSLTKIRADNPAVELVQRRIQRATLKRLDRAYKAFFRRVKSGEGAPGFPKFKGRDHFDGFAFDAFAQVKWDGKRLRFAGVRGGLRVSLDRPMPTVTNPETGELVTNIKGIHFKRERSGRRWYVGFQVEAPVRNNRDGLGKGDIGADWGTSVLAHLSSGEIVPNPRHGEAMTDEVARAQRKLSRAKKGSHRRLKARRHLAALQRRAAPYLLHQMIAYKARRENAITIEIEPGRFTREDGTVETVAPTQECFWCGLPHHKGLAEAEHVCTTPGQHLGLRMPRKLNAARVILKRALAQRDEGSAPVVDDRGGPAPAGAAKAANGGNGLRRPRNTAGGQLPAVRRSRIAEGLPPASELPPQTHEHPPRPPPEPS